MNRCAFAALALRTSTPQLRKQVPRIWRFAAVSRDCRCQFRLAVDMDADMGAGAGGEDVEEAGAVQLAVVAVQHGDRAVNGQPLRAVHVENEAVGDAFA